MIEHHPHHPTEPCVQQILSAYERMEPGESDAWNPLYIDFQLTQRLALFYSTREALRESRLPQKNALVLDIGCGTGRGTRIYLDLGFLPEQLHGTDLRPNAIATAKKMHPTIQFSTQDTPHLKFSDDKKFHWISLVTVLSSIKDPRHRQQLIEHAHDLLLPSGFLFYFDLPRTLPFAGEDRLDPLQLIGPPFRPCWHRRMYDFQFIPYQERLRLFLQYARTGDKRWKYWLKRSIGIFIPPSHEAALFQKAPVTT